MKALFVIFTAISLCFADAISDTPDIQCHFELGECPNELCPMGKGRKINPGYDYGLNVNNDFMLLYDAETGRFVDTIRWENNPELENVILTDNL